MVKYDEVKGFIYGISDDEFEVLLHISFTLNNFKVEKIRRSSVVANDFLLGLTRVEKRFLRGERTYNYVAYVDRKRHEVSSKWMADFWLKASSNEIYLHSTPDKEIEKIKNPKSFKRQSQLYEYSEEKEIKKIIENNIYEKYQSPHNKITKLLKKKKGYAFGVKVRITA